VATSALLAGGGLLWTTRSGPGLSPDSLKYLLLARSLAGGHGFRYLGAPAAHYPPGYPLLLAMTGGGGPMALERARIGQASLFALNAALVALAAARVGRGILWTAPLALLMMTASPKMLLVHAMVYSEPAFIALALGAGLLLSSRLAGAGIGTLMGAALCLAGALLVRYAGLALLLAALLALLLWNRAALGRRLRDGVILLVVSFGPSALWLTRNTFASGSATNRSLAFHPFAADHLAQFAAAEVELWGSAAAALLALVALLAPCGWWLASVFERTWGREDASASAALCGFAVLACLGSVALLVVSISLFDFDTPVDFRLLAPTHAFVVVLVASIPAQLRQRGWSQGPRLAFAALALLAAVHLRDSAAQAARFRAAGEGFDTLVWCASPTIASLQSLPPGTAVISNVPEVVAFFAHPNTTGVPASVERTSMQPRRQFERELAGTCAAADGGAVIAYLGNVGWAWDVPTHEALRQACTLRVARRFADGVILVAGSATSGPGD
jgi:hypothetical protein